MAKLNPKLWIQKSPLFLSEFIVRSEIRDAILEQIDRVLVHNILERDLPERVRSYLENKIHYFVQ